MFGFLKRKKNEEAGFVIDIHTFRSIWTQNGFDESLRMFYQGRYKVQDYIRDKRHSELIETCEMMLPSVEPYIIWEKMRDFRKQNYNKWVKYCKKNGLSTDSFESRDFFYDLLSKKIKTKPYTNLRIKQFNTAESLDIPYIDPLLEEFFWTDNKKQFHDLVQFINAFDELDYAEEIEKYKYLDKAKSVVLKVVEEAGSEGVLQASLKDLIDDVSSQDITTICYYLAKNSFINREKNGSSYLLTIPE